MHMSLSGDIVTRVREEANNRGIVLILWSVESHTNVAPLIFEALPQKDTIVCFLDPQGSAFFLLHPGVARKLRCCCNGFQPFTSISASMIKGLSVSALAELADAQPANGYAVKRGFHTCAAMLTTKQILKKLGIAYSSKKEAPPG